MPITRGAPDPELALVRAANKAKIARGEIVGYAEKFSIEIGVRGTVQTLEIAGKLTAGALVDPAFPLWARGKILGDGMTDPRDGRAVLERVFHYVQDNVGFQGDPLTWEGSISDYIQSPHWTLFVEGYGDCLAHAGAVGSVTLALGHGVRFRVVHGDPRTPERFTHVYDLSGYVEHGVPTWLALDTTFLELPGYEVPDLARYAPADYPLSEAA